jgi:geranylgeranyl diphosphate synthase type I
MYSPGNQKKKISDRIDLLEEEADLQRTKWGGDVVQRIINLSKKGKMVRGSLMADACEALEAEPDYDCAAAVELTHTGLLIHDDIIDGDEKRRGQDAIHLQYAESFEEISGKQAESLAICAGDICFFLAYKALDIKDPKALSVFSQAFMQVGAGQMRDVESSSRSGVLGEKEVLEFYRNKTASYSFVLPLQLASIIGKGETSEKLEKIGYLLGELFQVKDDAIDFAPEDRSGKPSLSDLKEGKNTIYTAKLLEKIDEEELQQKLEAGQKEARELRDMIVDEGIDEEVERLMDEKRKEIEAEARKLENSELRDLITGLAEFIVEREK